MIVEMVKILKLFDLAIKQTFLIIQSISYLNLKKEENLGYTNINYKI